MNKPVVDLVAKNIIIATGARARTLPGMEGDGKLIWTYKEAMVPAAMPKSLLVVGSGAIGIEFASFYRQLGAEVTVVEVMERILPVEDEEVSFFARKQFEKLGMKILTGAKVTKLDKAADRVTATVEANGRTQEITAERVIMAVGIVGNTENLGLEGTKVKVERGQIITDDYMLTGEPGVYAIGDVAGAPWLAHKASHEGIVCVEKIAGIKGVHPMNKSNIPGCTYSSPQVASVGLTEKAAKEKGHEIKVGRFSIHRQRQGHCARRTGRVRKNHLRRENRRIARRAYGGGGSHGADSRLRHCQDARDNRSRADRNSFCASDLIGDDA